MPQAILSSLNLYRALRDSNHMDHVHFITEGANILSVGDHPIGCIHRGEFDFSIPTEKASHLERLLKQLSEPPITISCDDCGTSFTISEITI